MIKLLLLLLVRPVRVPMEPVLISNKPAKKQKNKTTHPEKPTGAMHMRLGFPMEPVLIAKNPAKHKNETTHNEKPTS